MKKADRLSVEFWNFIAGLIICAVGVTLAYMFSGELWVIIRKPENAMQLQSMDWFPFSREALMSYRQAFLWTLSGTAILNAAILFWCNKRSVALGIVLALFATLIVIAVSFDVEFYCKTLINLIPIVEP